MEICHNRVTEFGLPEFFAYPINKVISTHKLKNNNKSSKSIKIQKNNLKKNKRKLKDANNNNKIMKTKFTLSSVGDNVTFSTSDKDNNDNNNNNEDQNNENIEIKDTLVESDFQIVNNNQDNNNERVEENIVNEEDVELKQQQQQQEDNIIENNEFKLLNVNEIEYIEGEEDIFESELNDILGEMSPLIEQGEDMEYRLLNKKTFLMNRSSGANKKEKINPHRYICHIQQNKESNKSYWQTFHYSRQADHRSPSVKIGDIAYKAPPVTSYEQQLNQALKLSQSEYDKQMKKNQMPLTQAQINDLLNRELTPEDYELLCLLDSTVKPKTISQDIIEELPTVRYTEQYAQFPSCMICLFNFEPNEHVTKLPCSHIFHINCISNWLANASTKCPIDNVPIHDH
ncbi:RING zinc finger-containing protein [Tieghemostelium lacteum]|uniref:RING zinc finger-containing protein n=1 Tax=Tieghemostelium lacteum TaxID=361077 RepID=A0A151Z6J0_TIELA|nr:RING zinc finger-containing protein [Tieghemostelium lacteum]|eukprot:KYQ89579.1 RING zinc finger-containing protein [Tieghemostelium lacteum]